MSAARATNQLVRRSALLPFESGGAFRARLSITDRSCLNTPRDLFLQPWVHYSGRGSPTNFARQLFICHMGRRKDVDVGDLKGGQREGNVLALLLLCISELAAEGWGHN